MKINIELPDMTLRRARDFAAARGIALRRFFTNALAQQLRRRTVAARDGAHPRAARAVCGSLALATVVLSLVADLLGPMGILVYALVLSLPAWILYAALRLRANIIT